jgi:hypothetical protein
MNEQQTFTVGQRVMVTDGAWVGHTGRIDFCQSGGCFVDMDEPKTSTDGRVFRHAFFGSDHLAPHPATEEPT